MKLLQGKVKKVHFSFDGSIAAYMYCILLLKRLWVGVFEIQFEDNDVFY